MTRDDDLEDTSATSPLLGGGGINARPSGALGTTSSRSHVTLTSSRRYAELVTAAVLAVLITSFVLLGTGVSSARGGGGRKGGSDDKLWPTYVGYEGPTPTGVEAFAAATGYPSNFDTSPLKPPKSLSPSPGSSFNILHQLGNLSPWRSVNHGLGSSPDVPEGCTVEQVHLLHRHGARYPTSDAGAPRIAQKLAAAKNWKATGPLEFLNTFKYKLGAEILTPFGREQLFNLGTSFRVKYGHLLDRLGSHDPEKRFKPVFRTESQDRMLKSALNFAAGFFGIPYEDQYHQLITIEAPGFNNTLSPYMTCLNAYRPDLNAGPAKMREWIGIYLKDTLPRLQPHITGFELSIGDLYNFQMLCAYETVSLGASSFCELFTEEEWVGFEYSLDLGFWYGYSFGHPAQAAIGLGWVQEFLARVTETPIIEFNSTTNSSYHTPDYFPIGKQNIYVDATHDTIISAVIVTLGFSSFAATGPLPSTHIPKNRSFITSSISPFASNLQAQILSCPAKASTSSTKRDERYVRWLLNDGVVPLDAVRGCGKEGLCELGVFVDAVREKAGNIDWEYDCLAPYKLGDKPIVDGRPTQATLAPPPPATPHSSSSSHHHIPTTPSATRLTPAPQATEKDPAVEYSTFLHPLFDPNQFAHSIVNGDKAYDPDADTLGGSGGGPGTAAGSTVEGTAKDAIPPPQVTGFMKGFLGSGDSGGGGGDVSAALARLNFGVEDLSRQLKSEITKHHSSLLLQAASLGSLEGDLSEVRRGLVEIEGGVGRLRKKIANPHSTLSTSLLLLTRLRRASSLARRASRFTVLARRLEGQMAEIDGTAVSGANGNSTGGAGTAKGREGRERRERAMAEAALTLAELETLLTNSTSSTNDPDDPEALLPIRSLTAVETNLPHVAESRQRVVEEMETMVQRGLSDLDNPLLASSLQTAYNLSVLPALAEGLMKDLTDSASRKIRTCFDMVSLAREMSAKDSTTNIGSAFVYKSRARNEPTQVTMPLWTSAMWSRLETLVGDLGGICIKVYMLEKILKLKRDPTTQLSFLDETMTVLDNKPSLLFWTTFAQSLETQAKETVRSSTFIQSTFSSGYPRLLRLLQEFFSKVAVHTDTVYTQAQQSPETILLLRACAPFEKLYLTRSTNRLSESVSSSFSISSSLSASFSSRPPSVPTANEGLAAARAIVNELDAARFDPLLVLAVAKGAASAVETFAVRSKSSIVDDHTATVLLGPISTPAQHNNADLASSLYHLWAPLHRALSDHNESVREVLRPAVDSLRTTYLSIANPLIMAIRREFSSIITRMHRTDYSRKEASKGMGGASSYMSDLTEKLGFVKDELLANFRVGELAKEWALDLAKFTAQTYILHASIVRCPSEAGKLKLTTDTQALQFALSNYLSSHSLAMSSMGDQYKALKAFLPLLFLESADLTTSASATDVPTLILIHHILSRSSLPLPHQIQGWTEVEYVRWLNEHGEPDRILMVEKTLQTWREQGEKEEDRQYVEIVRELLARNIGSA